MLEVTKRKDYWAFEQYTIAKENEKIMELYKLGGSDGNNF